MPRPPGPRQRVAPAHPIPPSAPDRDALCASIGISNLLERIWIRIPIIHFAMQPQDPVIHQGV